MALNIVWIAFFLIAFIIALCKFIFLHDVNIFKTLTDGMFDAAKTSVIDVAFPLIGTMVFFLGIMNIAERAGAIKRLARLLNPLMKRLFPEVPDNHPAMGEMVMNFSANMLGLDSAATPFGLKAMESLQSINPKKDTASNAQIMFLVLHTSGLTIIPLSIISYRLALGSTQPASIFIPCVLATICTTIVSIIVVGGWQRLRWSWKLIGGIGIFTAFVTLFLIWIQQLSPLNKEIFSKVVGSFILLSIIVLIILAGTWKKIDVFDAFIEGAKGGFNVILKVIPYFVGMLVAIRVFRDSGALSYIVDALTTTMHWLGINSDFTPALPVAIMKPFSGSGARGMMIDAIKTYGPDSFVGQVASTLQGSSDTTFYIIALYFGSVGIKKVRYAVWAGLLADVIGMIIAITICYIFFR